MINQIKKMINKILNRLGFEIIALKTKTQSMERDFLKKYKICKPYSMTDEHRMYATYQGTKYCVKNNVSGDFVECGVWKGGNSMMICLTLKELNETSKKIYLYDTYKGMTCPNKIDVRRDGKNALKVWKKSQRKNHNSWTYSPVEEVQKNLSRTNYPKKNLNFIKGDVNKTLDKTTPSKIALLRLDTDFYDSTKKELEVLYPKLVKGGVLLIDDYDSWAGARKAVDEYFKKNNIKPLLILTGNGGRIMVKQ